MPRFELPLTSEIVRLEQVEKCYDLGDLEVAVLQNINLIVGKGEYCAIMGPSGSGKSTAMNIIFSLAWRLSPLATRRAV